MKVEFITNASFLFTLSDGITILADPWYTEGIYHGTMFNYPPFDSEEKKRYLSLKPDYIYISHIHGDHFDGPTLANFDKNTPIIIGRFPTPALTSGLKFLGFKNIIEYDFDRTLPLGDHLICIYQQFSGSSDDLGNDTGIPVDSSIFIEDVDGSSCFFAVDNPMQERHATLIKERHGEIDMAILAYSGASIYPFVFKHYSEDEKHKRVAALRKSRLDKFCMLAGALGAKLNVPAAGSFVFGGVGAKYAPFLHQATPGQITENWLANKMAPERLALMATGDEVALPSLDMKLSTTAVDRNYTEQDRIDYANSIADFPCNLNQITWPETLPIPWKSMIARARIAMWGFQVKLNSMPDIDLYFIVQTTEQIHLPGNKNLYAKIALSVKEVVFTETLVVDDERPRIEFYMSANTLLPLLIGSTYWNVAEYHMKIARYPDTFEPTVRSLLAYYRL